MTMSFRILPVTLVLYALLLCTLVHAQQSVNVVFPPPLTTGSEFNFPSGQNVHLQWTSTFHMFTLQIWQGPDDDGTRAFQNLLTNHTNITQNYQWLAQPLAGMSSDVPMHIRLLNPADKDCETCQERSVSFSLVGATNSSSSNSSAVSAPGATANKSATKNGSNLTRGLGLGLGLGLPLVVVITVLTTRLYLRRRWPGPQVQTVSAYEAPMEAWRHPPPVAPVFTTAKTTSATSTDDSSMPEPKTPEIELDGPPIAELQPEVMRVEAPRDAEMAEMEDSSGRNAASRKWFWHERYNVP